MIIQVYSSKVMDHFRNPRNVGEIADPDAVGTVGNPADGDMINIYVKIKGNRIDRISFRTLGCPAAIATSSIFTELVEGRTIEEALGITKEDIARSLDGLPAIKMYCSNLALDAFRVAVEDYAGRR